MNLTKNLAIVTLSLLVFAGSVYSATTIGSNITTAGNLEVTGNATTTGNFIISGGLAVGTGFPDDGGYGVTPGYVYATSIFSDLGSFDSIGLTKDASLPPYLGRLNAVLGSVSNDIGNAAVFEVDEVDAASGSSAYGIYSAVADTGSDAGAVYGIYASATGGTTNYAGYFDGDVKITGAFTPAAGESAPATAVEGSFAVDTAEQDCFDAGDGTDGGSLCVYTGEAWVVVKTW